MSRHHPGVLSGKQLQAVTALLSHATTVDAARAVGVTPRTLWIWQSLPQFKARLEQERQALADEIKNGIYAQARAAIEGIAALVADPETPAAVKLRAYLAVLDRVVPAAAREPVPDQAQASPVAPGILPFLEDEELHTLETLLKRAEERKQAATSANIMTDERIVLHAL